MFSPKFGPHKDVAALCSEAYFVFRCNFIATKSLKHPDNHHSLFAAVRKKCKILKWLIFIQSFLNKLTLLTVVGLRVSLPTEKSYV